MREPIRVLHVVVNMERGGAETLLMNVYRNINRSKVQFDFLTCQEGVFDKEIQEMGGRVHRIPYVSKVGHLGYMKALNKFFQEHDHYAIVHSHLDKMSGFVLRAAKKANVPVRIAHSHNTSSEGNMIVKLYKWYAGNHILPNATNLMACSDKAARWLFTAKAQQAFIVKNGVDTKKFSYSQDIRYHVRKKLGLHEDAFVVGHVGRFCHQKNHLFLIEAFHELIKKKPNATLLLVGDGPLRSHIEEKITTLNLHHAVHCLGERSNVHEMLQAFDTFVFPSFHEGLPVTLVEAQAAGLPCVIANTITDEVDLGAGLVNFLELGNPREWADKISVQETQFRHQSSQYIKNAGFDISTVTKDITAQYEDVLANYQ